ncbi:HNH endonuclease [Shewanella algae]|uniref:HNH endonuclease n=1 Tax=Shewanella algae TaxID=38313 RepID=UPI003AB0286F
MECFLCDEVIDKNNDSKEHIFLNCIGGKKKVSGFICQSCNSETGKHWDNQVDSCLSPFALYFEIKRDRGKVQSRKVVSDDGVIYYHHPGRFSSDRVEHEIINRKLIVRGPSEKRVRQHVEMLIKENKLSFDKRNFSFTKESIFEELKFKEELNLPPLNNDFSKSIAKTAVAFLAKEKFDISTCNVAKSYLTRGDSCCVSYGYGLDVCFERPFGIPFHYIRAYNEAHHIYAYIELYGFARYHILLSDQYKGDDFCYEYSIDPTKGKDINLTSKKIISIKEEHPARLFNRIFNEYNFKVGHEGVYFSQFNTVRDKKELKKEFSRVFYVPALVYVIKNISKIERIGAARRYLYKSTEEMTKLVLTAIKKNKKYKSDQ